MAGGITLRSSGTHERAHSLQGPKGPLCELRAQAFFTGRCPAPKDAFLSIAEA